MCSEPKKQHSKSILSCQPKAPPSALGDEQDRTSPRGQPPGDPTPAACDAEARPESKQERARRLRRQRKLKKLEQKQEKLERKTKRFESVPGQRIYRIPGRLRPLSLFIRMGTLQNEQELIPQEFYDLEFSQTNSDEEYTPHPAAVATRDIFHLSQAPEEVEPLSLAGGIHSPTKSRSSTSGRRSTSVQFPLKSALKKADDNGDRRRPRSLRFLDYNDVKLYETAAHTSNDTASLEGLSGDGTAGLGKSIKKLCLSEDDVYLEKYLKHGRCSGSPPPSPESSQNDLSNHQTSPNSVQLVDSPAQYARGETKREKGRQGGNPIGGKSGKGHQHHMLSAPSGEIPSVFRNCTQNLTHGINSSSNTDWSNKITLKLLSPGEEFTLRTLTLPASIGRASDVRVRASSRNGLFSSPYLSRHHAVIKMERGRVVVEDLGSSNGTFVNGVCVKAGEPCPLADGDLVQFGSEDDNANNAAIVAQAFYGDSPELQPLSSGAPHPAHKAGALSFVLDDDDPFAEAIPVTATNSHIGAASYPYTASSSYGGYAGKNDTFPSNVRGINPHLSHGDQVGSKIASISRSLASLGVSLRTSIPPPSAKSAEGTLRILSSIEALVHELSDEDSRRSGGRLSPPTSESDITIHQKPTLNEALRIITTYEAMFCVLAVLFVYTHF